MKPHAKRAKQGKDDGKHRRPSASEKTLDKANEMTFPASDPIATSNISRIATAPETARAATDHQNSAKIQATLHNDKAVPNGKNDAASEGR